MTETPLSDTAIREKAYELWEQGGRLHGTDKQDWDRARQLLSKRLANGAATTFSEPKSPESTRNPVVDTLTDSMLGAVELATGAAHAIAEFFGAEPSRPTSTPATAAPVHAQESGSNIALAKAEASLQLAADKRLRDVKSEAATKKVENPKALNQDG